MTESTKTNGTSNNGPEQKSNGGGALNGAAEGEFSTPADIHDKRIQELEAKLKEQENKYLYLYAEFENYKKRSIKERSDLIKFGWEPVARDLLQILDNLERAMAHIPAGTDKNFVTGLEMTLGQFKATLQKQGVESIRSIQSEFDPNLHEAVAQEESEHPAGTIVKEHVPGYTLHGRLLRPSRVTVSQGKNS